MRPVRLLSLLLPAVSCVAFALALGPAGAVAQTPPYSIGSRQLANVGAALSAAGTNQSTATAIVNQLNDVTTVGAGTGVVLPAPAAAGYELTVCDDGANQLSVYPASGGAIGAGATNTPLPVAVKTCVGFDAVSTTAWRVVATVASAPPYGTSVVYVPCGATLSAYVNSSSPANTYYQLGDCTYTVGGALTEPSGGAITISGDQSAPAGQKTIIDGGAGAYALLPSTTTVTNVTLRYLTIQNFYTYSAGCLNGAVYGFDGWRFTHVSVINNGCVGIILKGASQVDHSYVAGNGETGINPDLGYSSSGGPIVVSTSEVYNNGHTADVAIASGGIKIINLACPSPTTLATQAVHVYDNNVHGNNGNGVWGDCGTSNASVTGNTINGNYASAIRWEVSAGYEVSHNVMYGNDTGLASNNGCFLGENVGIGKVHDNLCVVTQNSANPVGIYYQFACRSDWTLTAALLGNVAYNNTVSFQFGTGKGGEGFEDDTNLGAVGCSGGETFPTSWSPTLVSFFDNLYLTLTAVADAHWNGNYQAGGYFPNFSLATAQGSPYNLEPGSVITTNNAAYGSSAGCQASALSGQFCDQGSGW